MKICRCAAYEVGSGTEIQLCAYCSTLAASVTRTTGSGLVFGSQTSRPSWSKIYTGFAESLSRRSSCKRASVACVITSWDHSRVLAIGYNGNYKNGPNICDSDEPGNCGCFPPNSLVVTRQGKKKIQHVEVGDEVLTHRGRYRKVTDTLYRSSKEREFTKIKTKHRSHEFTSTSDHPVYVERAGGFEWVKAGQVVAGDILLMETKKCRDCDLRVHPYKMTCRACFRKSSKGKEFLKRASKRMRDNNPMKSLYSKKKLKRNLQVESLIKRQRKGQENLKSNLLSHAKELNSENVRAVVVDHIGYRPDIILIDWEERKVTAYEYERRRSGIKPNKYDDDEQFDDVFWHVVDESPVEEQDLVDGFLRVEVLSVRNILRKSSIHNLEVEEDESYVCQNIVVHNCIHAEENAIIKLNFNESCRKRLYTTLSPCVMCSKKIINAEIDLVVYTQQYRDMSGIELLTNNGVQVMCL